MFNRFTILIITDMRIIFMPKGTTSVKISLDDLQSDEVLTILSRLSLIDDNFKDEIKVRDVMSDVNCMIHTIERKDKVNLADILGRERELADRLQVALPDLCDMYRKIKSPMTLTIDQFDTVETFALIWLYGFKEQVDAVKAHPTPESEETTDAYKRLVHAAMLNLFEFAPYEREFFFPTRQYLRACDNTYWRKQRMETLDVTGISD